MPQNPPINSGAFDFESGADANMRRCIVTARDGPMVIRSVGSLASQLCIQSPGKGTLSLCDASSVAAAQTVTPFYSADASALTGGQIIPLGHVCQNGIVVSSLPAGAIVDVWWFWNPTAGPFSQ